MSARVKRAWTPEDTILINSNAEWRQVEREQGPLVTPGMASCRANVTAKRIRQLIEEGLFRKVVAFNQIYILEDEFELWFDQRELRLKEQETKRQLWLLGEAAVVCPSRAGNGGALAEAI